MVVMPGSFPRAPSRRLPALMTVGLLMATGVLMVSSPSEAGPAPVVTAVTPVKGAAAGGTRVTVTGHGFRHVKEVKFGRTAGTSVRIVSASKLRVTSPKHLAGLVNVRVVTSHGSSA